MIVLTVNCSLTLIVISVLALLNQLSYEAKDSFLSSLKFEGRK
jgi:hypothetical protein